jgi:hypothetical protein
MIMCFTYMQDPYERDKENASVTEIHTEESPKIGAEDVEKSQPPTTDVDVVWGGSGRGSLFQVRSLKFDRWTYERHGMVFPIGPVSKEFLFPGRWRKIRFVKGRRQTSSHDDYVAGIDGPWKDSIRCGIFRHLWPGRFGGIFRME